jgi:site-specific DNA-methyltransferase (adenine-specific)
LGDCREILPTLGKVDAVVTDPPYFKVKGDYWDNEWDEPAHFLDWMREIVALLAERLPANGSLYLFASPQMAARVEVTVRDLMNVLAMITWNKGARRKGAAGSGVDVTSLRTFWQASSERIIFAEPHGSDEAADGEAGYTSACEQTKRGVFGSYLSQEFERASVSRKEVAALFPSASGGLTGCVSNWLIGYNCPTAEQYSKMRVLLGDGFLLREYEELRQEYEELRQEYEELRRPFRLDANLQWGDVWDFDPPPPTSGKHPCEKPLSLLRHIITVSTKPDAMVLDAFMGSGTAGEAALQNGRRFIGIERDPHWFDVACKRIEDAQRQGDFFVDAAA